MFKKSESSFEGDALFIAGQIRTFQSLLIDDIFMKSTPGKAMKGLIRGNALFKKIADNPRYKEQMIERLKTMIDEQIIDKAIKNIY